MATTIVKSDLRFNARVDYFETREQAAEFAADRRAEGFNVNGGGTIDYSVALPSEQSAYAGLFGVHWVDRKGEGFYG